ncbi:DUF4185 domain-containing protein [Paenibacillus psychroresistens]|uniref:DUF4185 domain-containing protein n=1 Tax=Paenibacillus psychroresistens TaxID=1778678 RepID=A0A6B8RX26_9BACL|nr:CBM35 domain-containing protein [Paenibacillus psychroresistens]QGQ99716.1 DUF4185 domain-containing protein [Paenibacillus psychroresistens]
MTPARYGSRIFFTALLLFILQFVIQTPDQAQAAGSPITMAGFGQTVVPGGNEGDTWDSTWRANGTTFLQNNDGYGWGGSNTSQHDRISQFNGSPDTPSTISGSNISSFLGSTYSTSIYEVDGALYHIICYSSQVPGNWVFRNPSLLKSTDGGATWINISGQTNTLPGDNAASSTFPSGWGEVNFVKYGQGGAAPNIDNAQTYVYLTNPDEANDHLYLARILRSDLSAWTTTFDKTKIQYYAGGAGATWSSSAASAVSIYDGKNSPTAMVYNYGLDRYVMTSFKSDSWLSPPIDSTIRMHEAPNPWGPWTTILEENGNNKNGDNLTWAYLMQSFTSNGGKKMWATTSGRSPYGLQLLPVYFTTNPVQSFEAETSSALTGVTTSTSVAGYTGSGYVTGFDSVGDKAEFTVNAATAGSHILKIRYNTSAYQSISFYVNGVKLDTLKLGKSQQVYATWTELTMFAWLTAGNNTITYKYDSGNSGNVNLDKLSLALYSTTPGLLPGPYPGSPTTTDDGDAGITYSGTWGSIPSGGYYNGSVHYSNASGNYAQYGFTGTSVKWMGAKNNDHGKADIYMDGVLDATIDTYSATFDKQQILYTKTGLSSGSHTIKIQLRSDKNAASSGYYTDVDAFITVPGATATTLDDNNAGITYSGAWSTTTTAGYYNSTLHYANTSGAYAQYTFTGTGIQWIGARSNDHGKVDIYIDGVFNSTLDTYSSTFDKQQTLFSIAGLASGSHTIKIQLRSDKNASSSNYYTDVDAFIVS